MDTIKGKSGSTVKEDEPHATEVFNVIVLFCFL